MNRQGLAVIHRWSARAATAMIGVFFMSTVVVEIAGDYESVRMVKHAIVWAVPALVVLLAVTGITGQKMAGRSQADKIVAKKRTTGVMAALGLLVLVPAAFALDAMAQEGSFGTWFWVVQGAELVAGATNFTLALLQMRRGADLSPARRAAGSRR
ncbi:hypothetical protein FIV42_22985 [Persicimonas caeni]|uniref:Transmembrane protein n=1 Tax=Persicimonas caeni TaxID=2292766 RepID=A0A4Y6PZ13_PERCE|nr:hypothetical protein [Persicimonas caeni]QDG53503.1 hypothetical protein FIV42_22985 [Persicimonas caeni]QED34724.1 hypothetical protein FRD00_22980 [Persicimonas caeni]